MNKFELNLNSEPERKTESKLKKIGKAVPVIGALFAATTPALSQDTTPKDNNALHEFSETQFDQSKIDTPLIINNFSQQEIEPNTLRALIAEKEKNLLNDYDSFPLTQELMQLIEGEAAKHNAGGAADGYDGIYGFLLPKSNDEELYKFYEKYNVKPTKLATHLMQRYFYPLISKANNQSLDDITDVDFKGKYNEDKIQNDRSFTHSLRFENKDLEQSLYAFYEGEKLDGVRIISKKNDGTIDKLLITSIEELRTLYPEYADTVETSFQSAYDTHIKETVLHKIVRDQERVLSRDYEKFPMTPALLEMIDGTPKDNSAAANKLWEDLLTTFINTGTEKDRYKFYNEYNLEPEGLILYLLDKYYEPPTEPASAPRSDKEAFPSVGN